MGPGLVVLQNVIQKCVRCVDNCSIDHSVHCRYALRDRDDLLLFVGEIEKTIGMMEDEVQVR